MTMKLMTMRKNKVLSILLLLPIPLFPHTAQHQQEEKFDPMLAIGAPDDDCIHPDRDAEREESEELARQGIPDLDEMSRMVAVERRRAQPKSDPHFKPRFKDLGADANYDPVKVYSET